MAIPGTEARVTGRGTANRAGIQLIVGSRSIMDQIGGAELTPGPGICRPGQRPRPRAMAWRIGGTAVVSRRTVRKAARWTHVDPAAC